MKALRTAQIVGALHQIEQQPENEAERHQVLSVEQLWRPANGTHDRHEQDAGGENGGRDRQRARRAWIGGEEPQRQQQRHRRGRKADERFRAPAKSVRHVGA
jgi:hypothetical protein